MNQNHTKFDSQIHSSFSEIMAAESRGHASSAPVTALCTLPSSNGHTLLVGQAQDVIVVPSDGSRARHKVPADFVLHCVLTVLLGLGF